MGFPVLCYGQRVFGGAGTRLANLVILTSELSCCRRTDVEKLATRFKGICADSATGDRAQRSGSMLAAFNGGGYVEESCWRCRWDASTSVVAGLGAMR